MAKFVIYKDRAEQYRWRLVANNGEKVAASEAYTTKRSASYSAHRIREIAPTANIEDNTSVSEVLARFLRR